MGFHVRAVSRRTLRQSRQRLSTRWLPLFWITAVLVFSACAAPSEPAQPAGGEGRPEPPPAEQRTPSPWGALPSSVGSAGEVRQPAFEYDPSDLLPLLPEKTGLPAPTDTIFRNLSGLGDQFARPNGTLEFDLGRNRHVIRYRLAEATGGGDVVRTVLAGSTVQKQLSVRLPEQGNKLYILSLEALDERNETVDTAFALIGVVPQEINAELQLDRTVFRAGERTESRLHLTNYGPQVLQFGGGFSIEQYVDGGWYKVPLRMAGPAVLSSIAPGEVYSELFDVPSALPEGRYRVVKEIGARGVFMPDSDDPARVFLAVPFEVSGGG